MELFKFCRSAFSRIVLVIVVDHDPRRGVSLYPCIGGNGGPSAQYLIALGIRSTNARGVTVGRFSFISMSPGSPLRNAPATAALKGSAFWDRNGPILQDRMVPAPPSVLYGRRLCWYVYMLLT